MQLARKNGLYESNKVFLLKTGQIRPNPAQPRKFFDAQGLRELAESIAQFGVLQPLTVRRAASGFELVAGERRLRASKLAGLTEVPCILVGVSAQESSLIALVENLQRCDLDFFEEAEGIDRLIRVYGLSQEEAARKLGRSQSAVANKLRLLRHPPDIVEIIRKHGLTERHARALLRLEERADRLSVLDIIIARHYNVAQTDEYIDAFLARTPPAQKPARPHTMYIIKDVRLFLNTVTRAVDLMRKTGLDAGMDKAESDKELVLTIRIPKRV